MREQHFHKDDLGWRIRSSSSIGKGNTVFNLIDEGLDGKVGVIPGLHLGIICNEVGRAEATVSSVQMHKKLARCDIGVSCASVAESAQVHAVNTSNHLLLERVVGCVEFLENCLLGSKNTSEM
jgi:hypothetical protein